MEALNRLSVDMACSTLDVPIERASRRAVMGIVHLVADAAYPAIKSAYGQC